jgi:hypothetical protein
MSLKKLILACAVLPFVAGAAMAADPLADEQMDHVTAGGINPPTIPSAPDVTLPTAICEGCTVVSGNGETLVYSGGFAGLLQAYYQRLLDKGYTNQ